MRSLFLITVLLFSLPLAKNLHAQSCTPLDPFPPGQIILPLPYIDTLPGSGIEDTAFVGVAFETALHVLCPSTYVYNGVPFSVNNISMATTGGISNMPAGITYACNPPNCVFTPNNPGCISIYGTAPPSAVGVFDLVLNVAIGTPFGPLPFSFPGALVPGNYFLFVKDCPAYQTSETASVCAGESYTFPDGTTVEIFADTSYTNTLTAVNGCDSLITTTVEVTAVETGVSQDGNTLTANAAGSSFQWIDCADNQPIEGELNASFTPTVTGNYAVVVTTGNCQDTSACFNIVINGAIDRHPEQVVHLSPNPVGPSLHIDLPANQRLDLVIIRDIQGKELFRLIPATGGNLDLDVSFLNPGLYFLSGQMKNEVFALKFLKR